MKNVTIYLGPGGAHLGSRRLNIRRHIRAGDDRGRWGLGSAIPFVYDNRAITNTTETVTVALANNTIWQAALTDVLADGTRSRIATLSFHTGSLQFPGPVSGDRLAVLAMEEMSSSSSSSSSRSYSSSSSSSASSSSSSSASSHSKSFSSSSSSSHSKSFSSSSSSNSSSSSLSNSSSSSQSRSFSSSSSSSSSSIGV